MSSNKDLKPFRARRHQSITIYNPEDRRKKAFKIDQIDYTDGRSYSYKRLFDGLRTEQLNQLFRDYFSLPQIEAEKVGAGRLLSARRRRKKRPKLPSIPGLSDVQVSRLIRKGKIKF